MFPDSVSWVWLRGRRWHLSFLMAISLLVPVALFIAYAMQSRERAFIEVEDRLHRRVVMLSEHAARVFETQVTIIDLVTEQLDRAVAVDIPTAERVTPFLVDRTSRNQLVSAIKVLDGHGIVLASSLPNVGANYSDREYFQGAMTSADLFVGRPLLARMTNEAVLDVSRRWRGGVVSVGVRTRYFEDIFSAALGADAERGSVAVFRADGTLLLCLPNHALPLPLPHDEAGLMRPVPTSEREGAYRFVPAAGGEHMVAFHQVGIYPVWVTAGMDVGAIQARWLSELAPHALLFVLAVAVLAGTSLRGARRARVAAAAEQRLQQAVTERTAEALDAIFARKEALAAAERANRAKSHFLASASHDLRQPIQGVRLFLDVLEGRLHDKSDRHVLAGAITALEGAESLLSTLRDVSTLEAGMIDVAAQVLPLDGLLPGIADEFAGQAELRGLSLRSIPCQLWVETDPVLLTRMLRNLLNNAVRYTESGRILLGCRRQGALVRVEVWDTGQGIPHDKLDSVFDDFVQVGNPERDRAKGLGLGLAVVRRMAALLGHEVGVRSHLGRGSVFWISLPVVPQPAQP